MKVVNFRFQIRRTFLLSDLKSEIRFTSPRFFAPQLRCHAALHHSSGKKDTCPDMLQRVNKTTRPRVQSHPSAADTSPQQCHHQAAAQAQTHCDTAILRRTVCLSEICLQDYRPPSCRSKRTRTGMFTSRIYTALSLNSSPRSPRTSRRGSRMCEKYCSPVKS